MIQPTVVEIGNWMDSHGQKVGEHAQEFRFISIFLEVSLTKVLGCGVVVERISGCNHMTVCDISFPPLIRD